MSSSYASGNGRTLVVYSYRDYADGAKNLIFFLNYLKICSKSLLADVIICGNTFKFLGSYIKPNLKRGSIKFVDGCSGVDFNDYYSGFKSANGMESRYSYFLYLNSSCIGPVLPAYIDKCNFLDFLIGCIHDNVHLVSPIIEIPSDTLGAKSLRGNYKYICKNDFSVPFAHTYCFLTDRIGMSVIDGYQAFGNGECCKSDAIHLNERLVTSCLLNEELSIRSLLKKHQHIDFLAKSHWSPALSAGDATRTCPEGPKCYFDADIMPYELMFYKSIRHAGEHRGIDISGIAEHTKEYILNILLDC